MKMIVKIKMIVGAGALSIKKLMYTPNIPENTVTPIAIGNMRLNWFVNKNAIAPGAINKPIDRIIPTAESVATIVSEIIDNNP